MFVDTDRIASKPQGFIFGNGKAKLRGHTFSHRNEAVVIECGREVEELATAEGAEAGIEVVEAAVDELEWDDLSVELLTEGWEDSDI